MRNSITILLLLTAIVFGCPAVTATETTTAVRRELSRPRKKKKTEVKADTVKQLSRYDKLFDKKKSIKRVDGLMSLHLVDGEVMVEIPEKLFNREMLIYSFTEEVSNPNFAFLGRRIGRELRVIFNRTDSLVNICQYSPAAPTDNKNISAALKSSSLGAILFSFPIEALSPDSTAVVFKANGLFLDDNNRTTSMNSVDATGFSQKKSSFVKSNSFIDDIFAYDDHVEVLSTKSYTFEATDMEYARRKNPVTVVARTVVAPLSEEPMMPRLADRRVGTATLETKTFSADNGSKDACYALRWRLEPKDKEAFARGEKVEPKEPIVFYVDTLFRKVWQEAIIAGIEKWNSAFEAIGFKNAIRALPYPKNDTTFNATNYRYNCVKYNQNAGRKITSRLTVDYRSGEIIAASIGVGRDVEYMAMQPEAMIKMGAYNPAVRGINLPDKELSEAVVSNIMRSTGECLGLSVNYAASAAYSIEQLRNPDFTAQHGFASSVMCPETYNYLAQPEDYARGVKVIMSELGPYDYYAIKWLYAPVDGATPKDVAEVTSKWIDEHRGDAEYKYTALSYFSRLLDPRYASGALSTDPIKAIELARNNQKYVIQHAAEWINVDGVDEVYLFLLPDFIFLDVFAMTPLYGYIGGYYLEDPLNATGEPTYRSIPMAKQKEVFKRLMDISADMNWTNNEALLRCAGINDNMSQLLELNVVNNLFSRLASVPVQLNAPTAEREDTYMELMEYAASIIFPKVAGSRTLSYGELLQFRRMVASLQSSILLKPQYDNAGNAIAIAVDETTELDKGLTFARNSFVEMPDEEQMLYNPNEGIKYFASQSFSGFHYELLGKAKAAADRGARINTDSEQQSALRLISHQISKVLAGE